MSVGQYQSQLKTKRKQRLNAEKKAGEYRSKESSKRTEAAKARVAASKTKSTSTMSSKLREAERKEKDAETAGKEANRWQDRAGRFAKEEATLMTKLSNAQRAEDEAIERKRKREQQRAAQQAYVVQHSVETRLASTERAIVEVSRQLPQPKPEKLRILLLGASSSKKAALRIGREQKRIRNAVETALHRDYVELDTRPAATTEDLLDGISKFRPHVVHFSGHGNTNFLAFEDEVDDFHDAHVISAKAFQNAIKATDTPPHLVVLNACHSAAQLEQLIKDTVPFAIGMDDAVADSDAINYAAHFYASIANGQSIQSSHLAGQAALELAGAEGAELPTLEASEGFDASQAVLVQAGSTV